MITLYFILLSIYLCLVFLRRPIGWMLTELFDYPVYKSAFRKPFEWRLKSRFIKHEYECYIIRGPDAAIYCPSGYSLGYSSFISFTKTMLFWAIVLMTPYVLSNYGLLCENPYREYPLLKCLLFGLCVIDLCVTATVMSNGTNVSDYDYKERYILDFGSPGLYFLLINGLLLMKIIEFLSRPLRKLKNRKKVIKQKKIDHGKKVLEDIHYYYGVSDTVYELRNILVNRLERR